MGSTDPRTGMMIVLEPDECWRLLRAADVGRLAVSIGDRPARPCSRCSGS
jgi:hypothetical protein